MSNKYDNFSVGYFPPYKKYYISNRHGKYTARRGILNNVVYFDSYETARNLLDELKNREKENG